VRHGQLSQREKKVRDRLMIRHRRDENEMLAMMGKSCAFSPLAGNQLL
jgi:hypothetical protein